MIKNKLVIFVYYNGHGGVDEDGCCSFGYDIYNKKIYFETFM